MSDIKLVRKHSLPIAQAKRIAQKAADDLASEYDLDSEWDGDVLSFSRSGVDGEMIVTTSEIRLNVRLGFLLKAFKQKLQQHVEHRLDELLFAATPEKTVVAKADKAPAKPAGKSAAKKSRKG
jgi:putative polyhydroxyalkanoate system protein